MPFDPHTTDLIPQIIENTSGDLQKSIQDYKRKNDLRDFNSGVFDTILRTAPQGTIPPDTVSKFPSMNENAQAGVVNTLLANIRNAQAKELQTQEQTAMTGRTGMTVQGQKDVAGIDVAGRQAVANTEQGGAFQTTTDASGAPIDLMTGSMRAVRQQRPLSGGTVTPLYDANKNLIGHQVTQPDGTIKIDYIANAGLSALLGGAAAGAGAGAGGPAPFPAATPTGQVVPQTGPSVTTPTTVAASGAASAPASGPRIRVQGPNGQTGTVSAGAPLPPGWTQIP